MGIGISIFLSFVLIIGNGLFSMSEMALVNASKPLLDIEAEGGDARAAKAAAYTEDPSAFLATIQVAITLVGFASSAVASTNLSDPFARWMSGFGIPWLSASAPALAPIIITLIVSYVSIVIGELVPKRIAMSSPEKIAKMVCGPLRAFQTFAKPLVWLTQASAEGLSRILGIKAVDEGQVSEEEIKYMVAEQDDLTLTEKRMIHDVFDLGDTIVRSVMTPRVDITAIEDTTCVREALNIMQEAHVTRVPVFHEDIDQVVGVTNIRYLIDPVLEGHGDELVSGYMHEATFVPDTKDLLPLLQEMQDTHTRLAIVVDEYGGTAGIVSVEDIITEIVGELKDEFSDTDEEIMQVNDREWEVDGAFSIDDAMELGWPIAETDEYETIAGWIMDMTNALPRKGETLKHDGWTFHVAQMDGHRISVLHVTAPEDYRPKGLAALEEGEEDQE